MEAAYLIVPSSEHGQSTAKVVEAQAIQVSNPPPTPPPHPPPSPSPFPLTDVGRTAKCVCSWCSMHAEETLRGVTSSTGYRGLQDVHAASVALPSGG